MKKSKVIVPALALLLLSTAATVSGSVAWFTANRTFDMDAGNFAVVNTKDNLNCVVGAGLGTKVNTSDKKSIELDNASYTLTDASFDHVNSKIVVPDKTGTKIDRAIALASADLGEENSGNHLFRETNVYSAFTWTMDFSLSFGAVNKNVGLYLDDTQTTLTLSDGSAIQDTGKAFRMAFIPTAKTVTGTDVDQSTSGGAKRVLAKAQTSAKCRFISTEGITGTPELSSKVTEYASPALIDSTSAAGVPNDGAGATNVANYLGTFTFAANKTVHLNYTVVVWYEGSDENITNEASTVYETVKSHLVFGVANLDE